MSSIKLPSTPKVEAQEVRAALMAIQGNQLAEILVDVVELLEQGKGLVVGSSPDEVVSPQEAAGIVGLSRSFVCRLLDQGVIPEQPRVGTHRKILVRDLEEFMENRDRASRQFAKSLARADDAKDQLVRDIAGVAREEASKFGY